MSSNSKVFSTLASNAKEFFADLKKIKDKNPTLFLLGLALIVFVIIGLSAYVAIGAIYPDFATQDSQIALPTIMATSADANRVALATPTISPTQTPLPTLTPIPSNLWVVNRLLDPVDGALVVEFKNLSTDEIKNGLCQSPHDPEPKVGDIFIAEIKSDYILLSPTIPGTSMIDLESKTQRFIFIH